MPGKINGKDLKIEPAKDAEFVNRGFSGRFFLWLVSLLTKINTKLRFVGQSNLPQAGAYILAANHQTYFDALFVMNGVPRDQIKRISCVAGADLKTNYGLLGKIMIKVGRAILLNRHGNPLRGLISAKHRLDEGDIIIIHPEGTRTYDGKIAELKNGVAYLASKSGVPIVPVYIEGGYEIFSRHMKLPKPWDFKRLRRKRLTVHYAAPIEVTHNQNVNEIMQILAKNLYLMEATCLKNAAAKQ